MTLKDVQATCLSFTKALIERATGAEMTHHLECRAAVTVERAGQQLQRDDCHFGADLGRAGSRRRAAGLR